MMMTLVREVGLTTRILGELKRQRGVGWMFKLI